METLHLNIQSPERNLFNGPVEAVSLPGVVGRFTLLPHHAPIVSALRQGQLAYRTGEKTEFVNISSGFVEMNGQTVSVCVTELTEQP
ncbi:MAG: F0F1 ATP synthase subunit epsilon [Bacteroides sp.]|nr:F0F1 ATP synthase subunit epsilon [Bacteroides sp.]